jgi:murein DD-endopeptidase MepM/ murein hydrolase activator NlpD
MSYIDDFITRLAIAAMPGITQGLSFPLSFIPNENYKSNRLGFNAPRPIMGKGRLHGACDLLAPIGTVVYAVDEGDVIAGPYHFYLGVYAIEIKHRFFTARYGEVKQKTLVKAGDHVEKGQPIAYIGKVGRGSMLHFEMFSGVATGSLSDNSRPPFMRRKDLMNPEPFLDVWSANLPVE